MPLLRLFMPTLTSFTIDHHFAGGQIVPLRAEVAIQLIQNSSDKSLEGRQWCYRLSINQQIIQRRENER